jgi:hypothetical protein
MSGKRVVSIMLVCSVASGVCITLSANMARADGCLVAPGSATPGRHWYYRTERATQKKCWHLDDASQGSKERGSETASQTFQTLMAASSEPAARAKNGLSEKEFRHCTRSFWNGSAAPANSLLTAALRFPYQVH